MSDQVRFLSVEDVLVIHEDTMRHEGGKTGLRDLAMLESAVAMPAQQFGGAYLHPTVAAMAAAYLYHVAQNHPFYDGNKRTGVMAALVFLDLNGIANLPAAAALEQMTMRVAASDATKDELIDWMESLVTG